LSPSPPRKDTLFATPGFSDHRAGFLHTRGHHHRPDLPVPLLSLAHVTRSPLCHVTPSSIPDSLMIHFAPLTGLRTTCYDPNRTLSPHDRLSPPAVIVQIPHLSDRSQAAEPISDRPPSPSTVASRRRANPTEGYLAAVPPEPDTSADDRIGHSQKNMMAQKCGTQRFLIFFEISQLTSRMPWVELPLNES